MRKEMVKSQLDQLRESLGGGCSPVATTQLWALYNEKNYAGMVKYVRDSLSLDLKIRLGLSNIAGPNGAPAWVEMPNPMPPFGTAEFRQTTATVFLWKTFLDQSKFEQVVSAIAHELSHIVLNGIGHALREHETAVDLAAMLLGYRDIYVLGCERHEVDVSYGSYSRVETRRHYKLGYLEPDEVRYAASLLGRPSEAKPKAKYSPRFLLTKLSAAAPVAALIIRSQLTILGVVAALAVFVIWLPRSQLVNSSNVGASKPQIATSPVGCQAQHQPIHGIYARYGAFDPIAQFTIRTPSGSNYYVKLENAETGRPIATYYVYGGVPLDTQVPAGTYVLKYAVGQAWCSEADLFGDATVTEKADRLFQFDDGYEYEVELIAQRGGNLPTNRISRGQF
ncbi:hypothetical protein SAMN05443247_11583 [Bradyrhizobium erythrophlei]|nr:hypothetical protein SAMN05443247_11583 [Bradyrhizobium erythrophlei]